MDNTRLLSEDEVADLLNVKPATLRTWRSRNKGPDWIVNPDSGRYLGYRQADVESWVLAGRVETGQALLASSRPVHTLSGPEPLSGPDECPSCGLFINGVYRRDRFNRLVCRPCSMSGVFGEADTVTGQQSTD